MNAEDLIGLREDELDADEREALRGLLERSPEARREHAEAQVLGSTLASLPGVTGGPSAQDILARARVPKTGEMPTDTGSSNPSWLGRIAFLAVAATLLLVIGLQSGTEPGTRARGSADPDAFVRLEAVAEGVSVRALADAATVGTDESVVFHVTTGQAGELALVEYGPTGAVEILRWTAEAGNAPLGGAKPLAWTPEDAAGGARRYVVEWCDQGGGTCVEDELVLHWSRR